MENRRQNNARSDDGNAFIPESDQRNGTADDLAEHLAEEHQRAVISGDSTDDDEVDDLLTEEMGGPYVVSSAEDEFGETGTEQVAFDVEKSALPQAVRALAIASLEEERDAIEAREEQAGDVDLPDADAEEESRLVPEPSEVRPKRSLRA